MGLLEELSRSRRFYGECPGCGEEFALHKAMLFPVKGPFPREALEKAKGLSAELDERKQDLKEQRLRMTERAEVTTQGVNFGNIAEKVAPSFPGFQYAPRDCRALFEPIDYLVFSGLERKGRVEALFFVDLKTGKSTLTAKQRAIREVVEHGQVRFRRCQERSR